MNQAAAMAPDAVAPVRTRTAWLKARYVFPLACLGVLAASLLLDPVRPTGSAEICLVKRYSGHPCPGCGITRAIIQCSRGNFWRAFKHNPLGPALWVVALAGATSVFWTERFRARVVAWYERHRKRLDQATYVGIVLLTLFGILRIVFMYAPRPSWWVW
jgi:hypothetical protein